jgi:hypothetical protein
MLNVKYPAPFFYAYPIIPPDSSVCNFDVHNSVNVKTDCTNKLHKLMITMLSNIYFVILSWDYVVLYNRKQLLLHIENFVNRHRKIYNTIPFPYAISVTKNQINDINVNLVCRYLDHLITTYDQTNAFRKSKTFINEYKN